MKKKLLSILLIASMVITVFTGCGNSSENTENTKLYVMTAMKNLLLAWD